LSAAVLASRPVLAYPEVLSISPAVLNVTPPCGTEQVVMAERP
jgi:hypothetical protein